MKTLRAQPRSKGFTLAEAVMSLLIVSILLVAAMSATGASALAQSKGAQRVTARLLADGLLNEILPLAYAELSDTPAFGPESGESTAAKPAWDDIDDFDGWNEAPPQERNGQAMSGLAGWSRTVAVQRIDPANPTNVSMSETGAKRITVTVKFKGMPVVTRVAIRTGAPLSSIIRRSSMRKRGSVYLAVLGVSIIVVTLAVGGVLASRVQSRASNAGGDMSEAAILAQSGLQLARLWISQDSNWRTTTRQSGAWSSGLAIGAGSVTISATDPIDGNFANRPHDPVTITVTAYKGQSTHTLRQTLTASPTAMPVLQYAIHTGGQFHVRSGKRVVGGAGVISTNGGLRNDGVIEAAAEVGSVTAAGTVYGGITTGGTARSIPSAALAELYAALGTEITVSGIIDKRLVAPGANPWGTPNPEGVYVIRSSGDVTLQNSRILGTLVIICPGKKVTLANDLFIEPARSDYPSLIVVGDLTVQCNGGAGTELCETDLSTNFNPASVPYNGVSDSDALDDYPDEIRGLVYVTGKIQIKSHAVFRGAVISASTATSDAVDIDANPRFIHQTSLYTNPPQGFTTSVPMIPVSSSIKQIVN